MLGLREHIGREVAGIAVGGDDQDFGGSGDEVDTHLAREQLFGGGHVDASGTDDAVRARYGAGAIRKGCDRLRATHLENAAHAQQMGRAQNLGYGPRAADTDVLHARHLCRNDGHHQGGGQRITAGRDVGRHGIERAHDLA